MGKRGTGKRGTRRRLALVTAGLAVSGVLALATPAVAEATPPPSNRAPAPMSCAGRAVRTFPFATGTVVVYKRPGYVCAVTLAKRPGGRQAISVTVQARGNAPVKRGWSHARTSPAVTVHAGHRCVRVEGQVGRGEVKSGWILC
ncbi:hypothetical protein [Streptomyces acidiscabies]|uniref:Secreted protein n=1 Tax=Streptomyces acidiscabies TaxID=42234 RepID=A0AAP6B7T8_9ACTN|nr:hypothetical protein [Streptomyces acidiscabies]MBP5939474.1 hypothetical protein [Streptomyces sp. LBUM 1476]MBZ3910620.1 hypothetical protein [Streptomyces acidiscabies]MDX2959620.1 hypothetical protein [Streptomyces acidiscabies]MDX3019092.1 hypothetical protein [Streptomyces acidiscabies]MDX3790827.1 hypothetical protein [Streptomyces acidiscabies]